MAFAFSLALHLEVCHSLSSVHKQLSLISKAFCTQAA